MQPVRDDATTAPSERGRETTARPWRSAIVAVIWLATIALIAGATWHTYATLDVRNDEYQLILLGTTVADGGRLYVDCWENKPPGIAWLNATVLWVTGGWLVAPWIVPGLVALGAVVILWWAARRLAGLTAALAALIAAALLIAHRDYNTPSINPDFYAAMCALAACSMMFVAQFGRARRRTLLAGAAGILWGLGICFKQTGVIGLVVMTVAGLTVGLGSARPREMVQRGLVMWSGVLAVLGASIALLALRGNLAEAVHAVITTNVGLLDTATLWDVVHDWPRVAQYQRDVWFFAWMGLVACAATLSISSKLPLPRPMVWGLVAWAVLEALFAMMGPSRSMRYWQALWPAYLWLTCCGAHFCRSIYQRGDFGIPAFVVVTVLTTTVVLGRPLMDSHRRFFYAAVDRATSDDATNRDHLRAIGEVLQLNVPADEPIYVLQYCSGIYLYAERRPAARFTKLATAEQRQEVLDVLERGTAAALVVPGRSNIAWSAQERAVLERLTSRYYENGIIGEFRLLIRDAHDDDSSRGKH